MPDVGQYYRPRWAKRLCLPTALLLFVTTAVAENTPNREQLQVLEQRIQQLKAQMTDNRSRYGRLQIQLQRSEEDIARQAAHLETLTENLARKQLHLDQLQTEQAALQERLDNERQVLATRIRAAYVMGRQEYLKLWLNQEKPALIGRMLTYYDYVNRARSQQIEHIQQTLQKQHDVELRITKEASEISGVLEQQTARRSELSLSHAERREIINALSKTLENQDRELKRLENDKRQLKALLGTLDEAMQSMPQPAVNYPAFSTLKGQLFPPVKGKILNRFGDTRIGRLKWQGILVAASIGEKVKAIAPGRVAFAEWFRTLGLLVIIDHGHGYMSLYGHNQHLYVHTGDQVEGGEEIAAAGNSGGQDNIALYFEIRHQGQPLNPSRWLR